MSLDKMQKMNHMIKELKKHGFANSSIDALNKVEKIYNAKPTGGMLTEKEKRKDIVHNQEAVDDKSAIFLINFEKFKESTSRKIDGLATEMSNIVAKMNEIISVVKELEKRPVQRVMQQNNQQIETRQESQGTNNQSQSDSQKKSHPRIGRLEPGDIDLKEHFNFANK